MKKTLILPLVYPLRTQVERYMYVINFKFSDFVFVSYFSRFVDEMTLTNREFTLF